MRFNSLISLARLTGAAICTCSTMLMPAAMAQTAVNTAPVKALPGDSVYLVTATMTDQNGRAFKLEDHGGKPVLVSMFYNSCKFVCPMLVDTMVLTLEGLSLKERTQLDMLLITFDPARDDVKALKSIADSRDLNGPQWTLARTDPTNVRKIAATLGIQYRLLADGEFNHTTVLVLLDGDGRIVGRTKRIGATDPAFIKLVKQTIQTPGRSGY